MSIAIKVEELSKQYRLGIVTSDTFREDAQRWWAKFRGKEDPFLKLGSENNREVSDDSKFVWSLKDVNFEVEQGDVLGIIGENGAGKSTLLKILSKITSPTTGSIKINGRIASLLEVGTGFHPELTGRENIYLNGAILGMRKYEIIRKLDEIIAFAGVEKYIDTPVKRYSSGMYVRLAFAVAAHLESEILIVDEVLAVGDIEFQRKCLGKISSISNSEGRTVIFVSHYMNHIQKLCNKGIYLNKGKLDYIGDVNSTIDLYQKSFLHENQTINFINDNIFVNIISFEIINSKRDKTNVVTVGETWEVEIEVQILSEIQGFVCALGITNMYDLPLNNTWTKPVDVNNQRLIISFKNDSLFFSSGDYKLSLGISSYHKNLVTYANICFLKLLPIQSKDYTESIYRVDSSSIVLCNQIKNNLTIV